MDRQFDYRQGDRDDVRVHDGRDDRGELRDGEQNDGLHVEVDDGLRGVLGDGLDHDEPREELDDGELDDEELDDGELDGVEPDGDRDLNHHKRDVQNAVVLRNNFN